MDIQQRITEILTDQDLEAYAPYLAKVLVSELGLREEVAQDSEPGSPRLRRIVTDWMPGA